MKVKVINKSDHALPSYETMFSAGMDLRAFIVESHTLKPLQRAIIKTGLFIALPVGYEAQVRPRSGLAAKKGITVLNAPGTIDADYRGEIGVILVTHGNLATELVKVMEHVVGPQTQLTTITIGPDDDMEKRREDILSSVQLVDKGLGAIILTDMFGGTPSNLAISIMEQANIDIIAGVNLPMLIKLASVRSTETISDAVAQAREAGQKYIMVASQVLGSPE